MSGVQDGLVFVDVNYSDGANESFNVSAITRIRQRSEKWCEAHGRPYPAVTISVIGMEDDLTIGNMSREEFKKRIQDAIDKHYDSIAEKFLLDNE